MKKNTTRTNVNKAWYEGRDTGNPVTVLALVKKKIYEGAKVNKWCLELASYNSKTSKYRRSWIVAIDFDKFDIKEGDVITCNLTIVTNSNNDTMTTEFILNDVITCNLTIVTNSNNDTMTTEFILNDVEVE